MLRTIAALFVAIALTLTSFAPPAAAANQPVLSLFDFYGSDIRIGADQSFQDNHTSIAPPSFPSVSSSHLDNVVTGMVNATETAAASLLLCYSLDIAATTVFPPAAALSAFCPAIPAIAGGSTAAGALAPRLAKAWRVAH